MLSTATAAPTPDNLSLRFDFIAGVSQLVFAPNLIGGRDLAILCYADIALYFLIYYALNAN